MCVLTHQQRDLKSDLPPSSLSWLKLSMSSSLLSIGTHEIGSTVSFLRLLEFCGSGIFKRSGGFIDFKDMQTS